MAKATQAQIEIMNGLMEQWQNANHANLIERYGEQGHLVNHDVTRYTVGAKMFHLVIGTSSAFLVDIATGVIYGNKGWLRVDYKKVIGNAYDPAFDAAALVRDRFRYGHFENAADGSLRQAIINR